jgi:Tol biopolymer transport system component
VVVDRDGGALRTISTEAIYPTKISWSPDGRYIVASARTPLFTSDLYVIGADGSGGHRLVTGREWAGSPAWSPDGSRILFAGAPEPRAENRADLFTIRPDGTGRTRVVQDVSFESLGGRWAPDGTRIIFARGREISHLVTANPDGSGEAELTRNFSGNLDPAWSR